MTWSQDDFPRALNNSIFGEMMSQINSRHALAVSRLEEYEGDDPVESLPLTEYQRGLMAGRVETWDFMKKMAIELEKIYAKKEISSENIKTTDS